ncbi:GntR family transcriptional regulator [Actinocorallia sp. API 0066]|uniref:GntR family transcriptional regulator n=1 Tax=Actinocorallia sp. API 0066 TaxID=2896846 RepID=UPI001E483DA9|nr:GntR family transcriptional regulator [Actinocorallia sp. API 0066]MCD0451547.1 GntR family transcriptional regulator [Actinocorallia sp. API 0066]
MWTADGVVAPLDQNRRRQLPDEVAGYVREQIMSGRLKPGDFLRIEPIAEAVGVSNTPVREGLLTLRSEGFVQQVPRRGFVVAPFTRQDVRDLFWVQAQLAGELGARAAKRITPEAIARLEELTERHEEAMGRGDTDLVTRLGHAFHREINLAADSYRLALLLTGVVKHLPNRFYATLESRIDSAHAQHTLLIEAMRERSTRKARSVMTAHILEGADHIVDLLEERGLWDDRETA